MALKLANKTAKVNYYGIEVDPEITWNGWEPGNKYTKKLVLKNVKFVTQKLNFSVPAKDVFTTTYPKTITLSAGTSFCLPITFKPHKKDIFEDRIDFQTTDGEVFTIPVKALLPQYSVDIPSAISCGIVAAYDVASELIAVHNQSELETVFKWCCAYPYAIEPASGILKPFETASFRIDFQPQDVSTFTMSIPFCYGDDFACQKIMTATSVAKYPNICILVDSLAMDDIMNVDGQIVVDFGTVSVGNTCKKNLQIHNASKVNASVEIIRADRSNPIDWVFSCPAEFSPVPSGTCLNIMMEYHPKLVLTDSVENFTIKVSNKCATFKVKCIGRSDGPSVSISQSSINFCQLILGERATQQITLTNNSLHCAIPFQFILDPDASVFHMDKCSGTIRPKDCAHVTVTFRPQNPIQYYRKIVCLVPDQEPIFIDVLGTCHDIHTRPHILQVKHLNDFRKRQSDGLSYFSPEILMGNVEKHLLNFDENNQLTVNNEEMRSTCETVSILTTWKEYFFSHNETDVVFSTPYIGQDENSMYFDGLEYINKQQIQDRLVAGTLDSDDLQTTNEKEKTFSLKNNTKGSIIIQWTTSSLDDKIPVFSVSPCSTVISPNETVIFTVKFKPDGPDRIYGSELEAFAYFKSQRQFELLNERFISPPFCVLLRCAGHSFSTKHQSFQPKFEFDRTEVVFPSINLNEMAFRSFTLSNKGSDPMIFNLQKLNESFSVKPILGQILPGAHQIFTVRFEPTTINQCFGSIPMKLNNRDDFVQVISALGSTDKAIISMDNNSEIFFCPTNIGNISSQRYAIKNISRILLKFEWKLHPDDSFNFRVYPNTGFMLPNEILTQQWIFSPTSSGKITIKALLMVQGISPFGGLTEPQYFPVRIIGEGAEANLEVIGPSQLEFEPLVVGSSAFQTFEIMNSSEATVYYQLNVTKVDEDESNHDYSCFKEEDFDVNTIITMKEPRGTLSSRCTKTIYVSVSPKKRRQYKLKIGYCLIDNDSLELDCIKAGNESVDLSKIIPRINLVNDKLVTVLITGVFPTLQVTDVQGSGPSQWLSKLNLWKNLSLDNFNVCLDSDPTTSELIFTMATRASQYRHVPVSTRALIDMNLGAAPQNSESTEIRLMFENCGSIETKLGFLFPEDLEIELEYWAETGEYTEEELHQMKIQDNKLFDIQPRKAKIKAGESVTVCITYHHLVVGTDRFPILLKLDHGREILLNITAVTLHSDRCYIHFPSNKHIFSPTPIGLTKAPIQCYEMYNAGAVPVHFELDLSSLQELMEANYDIPVLQCLNPIGDILPGQTFRLEWIFTPVEPKTYFVEIPFHINNGDCPKIKFTAIGYDQRYLGSALTPDQGLPGESGVPSVQSIEIPNQNAKLNVERFSIGTVPTFTTLRRIVFLNNITENKNITFSWNVTNFDDADYVYIYPQHGRLMAKESITCHVTLHTRNIPRFFDINLICEIFDESKVAAYLGELKKWEEEESRRNVEFTITDTKKKSPILKKGITEKPLTEPRKSSNLSYLPPVTRSPNINGQTSGTFQKSTGSNKTESELKNNNLWFKPEMPKPFFLHLGITGRSCPIVEFQKEYPDSVGRYTIDKPSMLESSRTLAILQSEPDLQFPIPGYSKEHVTLESVLTDIIGSIMEDLEFTNAIWNMRNESIPFYSQLPDVHISQLAPPPEDSTERLANGSLVDVESRARMNELIDQEDLSKEDQIVLEEDHPSRRKSSGNIIKSSVDDQVILDSLSFGYLAESIMENMIVNILSEANVKEVDLSSRPRLIALPPRSARHNETT